MPMFAAQPYWVHAQTFPQGGRRVQLSAPPEFGKLMTTESLRHKGSGRDQSDHAATLSAAQHGADLRISTSPDQAQIRHGSGTAQS